MAIAASTVWEVRTTGSDANGGGYSSGGTDYSQQDAAQLTVTDAAATGTTNLSSATGGFTAAMIGNIVNVVGQGRRQITAFVDTNNVTCDAAWGTFSGATANVGGAIATPGTIGGTVVADNKVYLKGNQTLSTDSDNVATGKVVSTAQRVLWEGYTTTRGDGGVVTITASGITGTMISLGANNVVRNIAVALGSIASLKGIVCSSGFTYCVNCKSSGNGSSSNGFENVNLRYCEVEVAAGNGGVNLGSAEDCTFRGTANGVALVAGNVADRNRCNRCVFYSTSGVAIVANSSSQRLQFSQCAFRACKVVTANHGHSFQNCVFSTLTAGQGKALDSSASPANAHVNFLTNCAFHSIADGNYETTDFTGTGDISLSADPFVDASGGNFAINSTSGGGAALRAAGYPSAFRGISTSTYLDVGAAQSRGGGGGLVDGGLVS